MSYSQLTNVYHCYVDTFWTRKIYIYFLKSLDLSEIGQMYSMPLKNIFQVNFFEQSIVFRYGLVLIERLSACVLAYHELNSSHL